MSHPRLSLALNGGGLSLSEGRIVVFGARSDLDLRDLPQDQCQLVVGYKPDHDRFAAAGWDVVTAPSGDFATGLVFLPRAKKLAKTMVAEALGLGVQTVVIDGLKTEGVDSLLKEVGRAAPLQNSISKAHGKLFWVATSDLGDALNAWAAPARQEVGDGLITAPGVFSADGIDPASRLLVDALPAKLGKHLADLGAGWGYLSRAILSRDTVKSLALVEADHTSLSCARENVTDERASFYWADATNWRSDRLLDGVIMNPPFHTGRAAEPQLGQAFIANAARNLALSGQLWLVANRQLPYEATLAQLFLDVEEIAGDNRFKVLHAARKRRTGKA
jgi:16S rRNA (guanine1207-N2)-methyltransferase